MTTTREALANPDRQKEGEFRARTPADSIWEKAWVIGNTDGLLSMARRLLFELLNDRFGPLSGTTISCLEKCEDVGHLYAAFKQALRIEKLEDLPLLKPPPEVLSFEQVLAVVIWEERWTVGEAAGEAKGDVKGELLTMKRALKKFIKNALTDLPEKKIDALASCIDIHALNAAYKALPDREKFDDSRL